MARCNGAKAGIRSTGYIWSGIILMLGGACFAAFGLYLDFQYNQWLGSMSRFVKNKPSHIGLFILPLAFCLVLGLIFLFAGFHFRKKEKELFERMRGLTSNGAPARDFLANCASLRQSDFTGVYVLHNKTKDMYYVGQSVKVIDRIKQHLTGHGNGDVYADFKYGDEFEVSTVSLADSGYGSLNDLERDTIAAYDAYSNGYNRTAGNAR